MDAAAMRTYLRNVIVVLEQMERRQEIQEEGLGVITNFVEFYKEVIETLCLPVRKPWGMIPNTNAAADNGPEKISNPGHSIPAICEKRLITAVYTVKIYEIIVQDINQQTMSHIRLRKV